MAGQDIDPIHSIPTANKEEAETHREEATEALDTLIDASAPDSAQNAQAATIHTPATQSKHPWLCVDKLCLRVMLMDEQEEACSTFRNSGELGASRRVSHALVTPVADSNHRELHDYEVRQPDHASLRWQILMEG